MKDILTDYLDEAERDAVLDVFTVKDVQSKLPAIKHKWVGRLIRSKRKLNLLYDQRAQIKDDLLKKAKEQSKYKVADNVLEKSIIKTTAVVAVDQQIKEYKLVIEFLERTEKIFSSMTFDIKNLTEIMKIETL
jgi:hypothetical protein